MKSTIYFLSSFGLALRPINLLLLVLTQLLTTVFLIHQSFFIIVNFRFISLCVITLLITASGYLLNDYYDRKVDAINKPKRAHFTNQNLSFLISCSITFIVLSIGISSFLSAKAILCILLNIVLVVIYAYFSKRMGVFKPILVSYLTASSIFLVGLVFETYPITLYFFSLWAFLLSLLRELVKDLEDIKGDQQQNSFTSITQLGSKNMIRFLYFIVFLLICSLMISLYWSIILSINLQIAIHSLLMILLCLVFGYFLWKKSTNYSLLSTFCKVMMLMGIIGMVLY